VDATRRKIQAFGISLTDREIAILSCATVELESKGYKPFDEEFVVQVDP